MEMPKIKRCPFCGGSATLYRNGSSSNWNFNYYIRVQCEICNAQGKTFRSADDPSDHNWETGECFQAIEAWNMRVPVVTLDMTKINEDS